MWCQFESVACVGLNMYYPEAFNIAGSINNGVLNVAMAQVILNEPGVDPSVCQGIAAGVAEHMGMDLDVDTG